MGRILAQTQGQKGWPMYAQLLIDLVSVLTFIFRLYVCQPRNSLGFVAYVSKVNESLTLNQNYIHYGAIT